MKVLLKIDRVAAWILFLGLFLYFITGLSMTKGILSPALASKFHLGYLTYFVLAGFVVHTSFAIHLALKRWRIWNIAAKIILILFYISFVSFFFYVDKIYQRQIPSAKPIEARSSSPVSPSASVQKAGEKIFSVVELAKYDGLNGNPAYAAVDGVVYDLSTVFVKGIHYGFKAGQDLTEAFYSKHNKSKLTKYPVVGILK